MRPADATTGQFCWVDLATADAPRATQFYARLFGWSPLEQAALGGRFTRLQHAGQDVGSLYQLSAAQIDRGVPSHWTPYIRVDDAQAIAGRVSALGGDIVVQPFTVPGVARIAIILDAAGAHVGLWEPISNAAETTADG